MSGLRLRLFRPKDPELTQDEVDFLALLCQRRRDEVDAEMEQHLVSESLIRERMHADDIIGKFLIFTKSHDRVGAFTPKPEPRRRTRP